MDELQELRRAAAVEQRAVDRRIRLMASAHQSGASLRAIASAAGSSPATVQREIRRELKTFHGHLVSVGYQGRDLDEMIGELNANKVEVLVDTRENAVSRRRGFSKKALGAAAAAAGIEYRHERALGNPVDNRDAFRSGSEAARSRYLAHLNNGSRPAYDELVETVRQHVVALLCFELDHSECHRSCIIDQMRAEHPSIGLTKI
jgi:uncharacterized protein (DUF488 family)